MPRVQRERLPVRSVPSALRLTYYDAERDYQTGEARAIASEQGTNEVQRELPAVLSASAAKALVQHALAREWASRDRLTLRLPPARIGLEPGSIVEPEAVPGSWIVEKCMIDSFVTVVELSRTSSPAASIAADPGRIVANADVVEAPLTLALIDAPALAASSADEPTVLITASSASARWSGRTLTLSGAGRTFTTTAAARKSVLGRTLTGLNAAAPYLIDEMNSVDIELVDPQQWLTSCDDDALAEGLNLAIVGSELVQFGEVSPLGQGRFRLAHLLRGRIGTEWATNTHSTNELFCLIDSSSLQRMALPVWMRGAALELTDRYGASSAIDFNAESITPLPPDNLTTVDDVAGNLSLSWTRRSLAGCTWLDEVDAPVGEAREQYRVTVTGGEAALELISDASDLTVPASDLATLGGSSATIEVRQIGDWAMSRPAQLIINLPQE